MILRPSITINFERYAYYFEMKQFIHLVVGRKISTWKSILPPYFQAFKWLFFLILLTFQVMFTRAQETRNFVDAMVNLNDDWETKPEILMGCLEYFYRSSRFSDNKANDILFIKAILENPVARNTLDKRAGKAALAKFYQIVPANPAELNSGLVLNPDICDFKPHYLCRLAYKKGFSLLRLFYEDDFRLADVNSGRVDTWFETKDHKIALGVSNGFAYKDFKFFEIDISDKTNISFKGVPSRPAASVQKSNLENLNLTDKKVVSQLVAKFKNQRISEFSKAVRFKPQNLTLIATDAGLFIYDSKTGQFLKFIKNFYTGNDVE
jgi:hypothetical protein